MPRELFVVIYKNKSSKRWKTSTETHDNNQDAAQAITRLKMALGPDYLILALGVEVPK